MVQQAEMKAPTKSLLDTLSDETAIQRILDDKYRHVRSHYITEVNKRMAHAKPGSTLAKIREAPNGTASKPKQKQHKMPWEEQDTDRKFWRSDRQLREETNFLGAVAILQEAAKESWYNEPGKPEKDPEDVEDFLQMIQDEQLSFEELSDKQQSLLGVIRRKHWEWIRKHGYDQDDEDEG